MAALSASKLGATRISESYLVTQINGFRQMQSHQDHKKELLDFDELLDGNFSRLFPGESGLTNEPVVENKLKNAVGDIARLANEAKGMAVFMKEGESQSAKKRAKVRSAIAQTIWKMGRADRQEKKLYIDLIAAGYAALSVYYNDKSEYPQFLRLNPRFCYPDVVNGVLQTLVYVETMKERQAARQWPDIGLNPDPTKDTEVLITMYFDENYVVQAVCRTDAKNSRTIKQAHIVSEWEHKLGCVPVAFVALDDASDKFHGLFYQLGGPMMVRNKTVRLMVDYLETMAHAPFEEKGVLNADDEPGPLTIYHHDPNAIESFIRRVPPGSPAGSVFGLLQYMDAQESAEAIQPPARVGVVSQSIASGSFVASTQGTLSSVVKDLQEKLADLRYQATCTALAIDEKYMDSEKPLFQAIGNQTTYLPSKDIKGFHYHSIQYGASAGLNRSEADVRILQHLGAKLISHETARQQIEYLEDVTTEDDRINREELESAAFQRFAGDPATPQSILWQVLILMNKGKSFVDSLEIVQPEMFAAEKAAQQPQGEQVPGAPGEGMSPEEQQMALGAGATEPTAITPEFAPPPLSQVITRNPVF